MSISAKSVAKTSKAECNETKRNHAHSQATNSVAVWAASSALKCGCTLSTAGVEVMAMRDAQVRRVDVVDKVTERDSSRGENRTLTTLLPLAALY